jgi:hypothetical protein
MSTRLIALVVAVLALVAAGCGSSSDKESNATPAAAQKTGTPTPEANEEDQDADAGEEAGGTEKDCDKVGDLDGKPRRKLPASVPLVAGARVYESQGPFGRTTRYFAVAKGDAEALPGVRDKVAARLTRAGYKLLAKDQEEGAEAEAHLSGKRTVDIQVINLCRGKVRIRYTVS